MAKLMKRELPRRSLRCLVLAAAIIVSTLHSRADAPGEGPVTVVLDQAKLVKLPERATTIIVGNPLIADVAVQSGGMVVITGKGYGLTNIVALDRTGAILMEKGILVTSPVVETVVVFRGVDKETYSCAPDCERRITLGDTQVYFTTTLGQTAVRNQQAQAATQSR